MTDSLFQVELVKDIHSALQDFVHIVHTVRVALHGQVYKGHLERHYVLRGHILPRLDQGSLETCMKDLLHMYFELCHISVPQLCIPE